MHLAKKERERAARGAEEKEGNKSESEDAEGSDTSKASIELHYGSSTYEDVLRVIRLKYPEFSNEVDMSDLVFKIGQKFRSFQQFREAVRNYGIKNQYVMNFRPNNKKMCNAFCKKGCPFYLWCSPMVTDKETVQIKSEILKHECTRDHHSIRHVSAKWIAKNYLEQFKAYPSWKLAGIRQTVRSNEETDISKIIAWRSKCIALR